MISQRPTLENSDIVTGFAIAKPVSWYADGSVDCYSQSPMEDVSIQVGDFLSSTEGSFDLALDLVGRIQNIEGTPYRYHSGDSGEKEVHVLRLEKLV